MHFGDPTLALSDALSVGWYIGRPGFNCYEVIADWAVQAAECIGASYVIFMGCGPGGFAALHCATYLPHSVSLAFNPETRVPAQDLFESHGDVATGRGELFSLHGAEWSVVDRYHEPQQNGVVIVQNRLDASHVREHYLPFRAVRPPRDSTPPTRYLDYADPAMFGFPTATSSPGAWNVP